MDDSSSTIANYNTNRDALLEQLAAGVTVDLLLEWRELAQTTWGNRGLADVLPEILGAFLAVMERIEQEECEREQEKWARLEHAETN